MNQLGKYEIIAEIGRGGFGIVYSARDLSLERMVALKVLHPQLTVDASFLERFRKEAKALARINHPNVVTIHEIGEIEGRIYIAMEYLPGGSLADRLVEGPLSWAQALEVAREIGSGLEAGHQEGLIHRDVKPGNILFNKYGAAVIADFGLAKAMQVSSTTVATSYGGAVGTPYYRAPELWNGTPPPSPATDVYALACVVYEMLTGEMLFAGDTPMMVMTQHANGPQFAPGSALPETVHSVLHKALDKDPQARYQDTGSFVEALVEAQKSTALEVAVDPPPVVDQKPKPSKPKQEKPHKSQKPVQGSQNQMRGKSALPGWSLWAGGAVLLVALVTVALLIGGVSLLTSDRRGSIPAEEPTEAALSQVNTPIPTATETALPTATTTKTSTATRTPTITPTSEPTLGIMSTMVNPVDGAVLVYVPEGEFLMGSEDNDAWDDEQPEHQVYLDAFWIYQHPVTNAQFAAFVDASGHETTAEEDGWSWVYDGSGWVQRDGAYWGAPEGPGSNIAGRDDHPVVQVSWFDAAAYCEWAEGRLPTEAEWEKAARGTDGRRFPWGDQNPTCSLVNYSGCVGGTSPVGSYPLGASPYGALDMAGNVWEWVADWYAEDYYTLSPYENPTGPTSGEFRVVRGGSWFSSVRNLRVSSRRRGWGYPVYGNFNVGFRCLLSP